MRYNSVMSRQLEPLFTTPAVILADETTRVAAHQLAERFAIPVADQHFPAQRARFILHWQSQALCLTDHTQPALQPFCVNFLSPRWDYRRQNAVLSRSPLLKALKARTRSSPSLRSLDLTGGWGRDAFLLVCAGMEVVLCERQPIIAALLQDGWQRLALQEPKLAQRLQIQFVDSLTYLKTHPIATLFDRIIIDPMYPEDCYTGQVKKEAQLLRALVEHDSVEDGNLFFAAQQTGVARVVVKRPRVAPLITAASPQYVIKGKTVRFDVYTHAG